MYEKIPNCSGNSFVESDVVDDGVPDFEENQENSYEEGSSHEYFEEYEWMSEQETHDEEYMRRLEEEELSNQCLEEMDRTVLLEQIHEVQNEIGQRMAHTSKLNPFAKEFVPSSRLVKN